MKDRQPSRPNPLMVLEDKGYRLTEPRRRIIGVLQEKDDGFDPEEICGMLPGIGRATVYRTIKLLVEAGLLCKLTLPSGGTRYNLSPFEHHHHTLCVSCGTVGVFRDTTVERILRGIGNEISGEIVGHRMELYTLCQSCSAKPEEVITN